MSWYLLNKLSYLPEVAPRDHVSRVPGDHLTIITQYEHNGDCKWTQIMTDI